MGGVREKQKHRMKNNEEEFKKDDVFTLEETNQKGNILVLLDYAEIF